METTSENQLTLESEKLQSLKNEYDSLILKERELSNISNKSQSQFLEQQETTRRAREVSRILVNQSNVVQALNSGGIITEIVDKNNESYICPDLRKIATEYYAFEEETILLNPKPAYIPDLGRNELNLRGYVFDSVRIEEDSYVIAVNGFSYKKIPDKHFVDRTPIPSHENYFAIVTLEQLVLTSQYYFTYAKAIEIKKAHDSNKRGTDRFASLSESSKRWYYDQKNFYLGMPSKIQKKYTKEQWDNLTIEEKQDIYAPVKRVGVKRVESKLSSNEMYRSLHKMYETFIDPLATEPKPNIAHNKVWEYWTVFREMMKWKINDLQVRKETDSEVRKIALETSFGDSNTNIELRNTLGIFTKRQNGSEIKKDEIDQIKSKWQSIGAVIGLLDKPAYDFGLKISHTGDVRVYASKAVGMFIPSLKAIAVSNKFRDSMFGFIMSHELAHFIDYQIGKKHNRNYASDNYESKAGILANILKVNYNTKTESSYTNSTKECFARAIEQYFAISSFGDEAFHEYNQGKFYFEADEYVNKEVYYSKLKPAVEDFISDSQWFFGAIPLTENIMATKIEIPESKRYSFDNEFGSFTSVFVYVPIKDAKEFRVETTVRKKNEDGTQTMQTKDKWFPLEKYNDFINDLKNRLHETIPQNEEVHSEENAQAEIGTTPKETENSDSAANVRSAEEEKQIAIDPVIEIEAIEGEAKEILSYEFKIDAKSKEGLLLFKSQQLIERILTIITTLPLSKPQISGLINILYSLQDKLAGKNKQSDFLELLSISNVNVWEFIPKNIYTAPKYKPYSLSPNDKTLKTILSDFTLDKSNSWMRKSLLGAYFHKDYVAASDGHILLKIKGATEEQGKYCLTKHCIDNEKEFKGENEPDFSTVIPERYEERYYTSLKDLASFAESCMDAYLVNSNTNAIVVKYGNDKDGNPLFLGINAEYLIITINAISKLSPQEKFDLGFSGRGRAITIKNVDSSIIALIMPVIIDDIPHSLYFDIETGMVVQNGIAVGVEQNYIPEPIIEVVPEVEPEPKIIEIAPDVMPEPDEVQQAIDLLTDLLPDNEAQEAIGLLKDLL